MMSMTISKLDGNKEKSATAIAFALMLYIAVVSPVFAQSVPIEEHAIIPNKYRSELIPLIDPVVEAIRATGWRCDSISSVRPLILSRGYVFVCNSFRYEYEIKDRGGNWVVTLK